MTFDEMRKLGPNWDSSGAQPIDQCKRCEKVSQRN